MKFALFPNYIFNTRLLNEKEADKVSHNNTENTDLVIRWNSVYDACSRVICFHLRGKAEVVDAEHGHEGIPWHAVFLFYF